VTVRDLVFQHCSLKGWLLRCCGDSAKFSADIELGTVKPHRSVHLSARNQFAEDAGPWPPRSVPDSFYRRFNFYTLTFTRRAQRLVRKSFAHAPGAEGFSPS